MAIRAAQRIRRRPRRPPPAGGEAEGLAIAEAARWNHNIHYHPLLLAALPDDCDRALDVGCGEGIMSRKLRRRVTHVSAIDRDRDSVERARREDPADVDYLVGDFLTFAFQPASFDFIVCVAALHHMDEPAALKRMRALLRPGGSLAVLGLPRSRRPLDLPRDIVATVVSRRLRSTRVPWESSAPVVWPPARTFPELRALAERILPGAVLRRHLLWRYSLIWTKEP